MQRGGGECYLGYMENKYKILLTLSAMVNEAPQPTQYQCIPREIILRTSFDWAEIYTSLMALQEEGLLKILDADGIRFSVTREGLDFSSLMEEDPTMKILGYRSLL